MTDDKTDGGPGRGDGEARGVSGGPAPADAEKWGRVWGIITDPIPAAEPVALPPWARQPMIDSGPVKHRIVHAWHDYAEHLTVLGSDGRIHFRDFDGQWKEIATYPQGLEP